MSSSWATRHISVAARRILAFLLPSILLFSCSDFHSKSERELAEELLAKAVKQSIELGSPHARTRALVCVASKQIEFGLLSQAEETLELAVDISTDDVDMDILLEVITRLPEMQQSGIPPVFQIRLSFDHIPTSDGDRRIEQYARIGALDKARALASNSLRGLIVLAEVLADMGLKGEVKKILEEIAAFQSDIPVQDKTERRIAKCFLSIGQEEQARDWLSNSFLSWSSIESPDGDPYEVLCSTVEIALLYKAYGDSREAERVLQKPLDLLPTFTDYYDVYWIHPDGRRVSMPSDYDEAKRMKAELKNKAILVVAYGYAEIGQTEIALSLLRSLEPNYPIAPKGHFDEFPATPNLVGAFPTSLFFRDIWRGIAIHLAKSGSIELARDVIGTQEDYDRYPMYQLLTEASAKSGDYSQCLELLDSISDNPRLPTAGPERAVSKQCFLALQYAECNRIDRAVEVMRELLVDGSWHQHVLYERSMALAKIGSDLAARDRTEEAKKAIKKAYELANRKAPESKYVSFKLKKIDAQISVAEVLWKLDE